MNAHFLHRIAPHSAPLAAASTAPRPGPAQPPANTGAARFARLKAAFRHAARPAAAGSAQTLPAPPSSEAAAASGPDRMAEAISQMLADPAWPVAAELIGPALRLLDRVHHGRRPQAGIDEALHARLLRDVDDYLDFRRLRAIEAGLRGCDVDRFAFGVEDWRQARRAEAGLRADRRRRIAASYLPSSSALFRVR